MINVLVDIDGTILLVPREVDIKSSAVMFNNIFNVEANEEFIDNFARPEKYIITEVLKKLGINLDVIPEKAYQKWAEAETKELKKNPAKVLTGAKELLTALLKKPNIKLSLLTGNSYFRAEAKLKSVGLDIFFRNPETGKLTGVFGEEGNTREELLLKFLGQKKSEDKVIILDDSLLGGEMAKKNNIPIILVATGKFSQEKLRPYTENVFEDLGEKRWKKVLEIVIE